MSVFIDFMYIKTITLKGRSLNNSVLTSCHSQWKIPYVKLRKSVYKCRVVVMVFVQYFIKGGVVSREHGGMSQMDIRINCLDLDLLNF